MIRMPGVKLNEETVTPHRHQVKSSAVGVVPPSWPWPLRGVFQWPCGCTFLDEEGGTVDVDDLAVHLLVGEGNST